MSIKFFPIIAISISIFLSGCATTRFNAATGEEEASSTTNGAAIGCVLGGIAGAMINGGKGALIGCGAAGGIGALAGSNLDKQEDALRKELLSSGVQVQRTNDTIRLIISGDISFATGSSNLSANIKPVLRSVVKVMQKYPDTLIQVDGHTDNVGNSFYNKELSVFRAHAVDTYLHASGLGFGRTRVNGYGESMPLCSNSSPEGRSCNRRVELTLLPQ